MLCTWSSIHINLQNYFPSGDNFDQLTLYVLHHFQGKSKISARLACFLAQFVCITILWLVSRVESLSRVGPFHLSTSTVTSTTT